MTQLNSLLLEGNLVADAEKISDAAPISFRIANNRYYKKDDTWIHKVTYMSVKFFGEFNIEQLTKGAKVRMTGRISTYNDKLEAHAEYIEIVRSTSAIPVEETADSEVFEEAVI